MTTYKTPGVYIEEIVKFPPSVAQVETAIPAFIGYTEKATKKIEGDLNDVPKRITSMLEYEMYYGSAQKEDGISVAVTDGNIVATAPSEADKSPFLMYYAMQMYFANGGGPCYITSVGQYDTALGINAATIVEFANLNGGLDAVRKVDEVTLLVFPDATALPSDSDFYSLYNNALTQCNELQDRFTIIDTYSDQEYNDGTDDVDPVDALRDRTSSEKDFLKYGAAYYPYLNTILDYQYDEDNIEIQGLDESLSVQAAETIDGIVLDDLEALLDALIVIEDNITAAADNDAALVLKNGAIANVQQIIEYLSTAAGTINELIDDAIATEEASLVTPSDNLTTWMDTNLEAALANLHAKLFKLQQDDTQAKLIGSLRSNATNVYGILGITDGTTDMTASTIYTDLSGQKTANELFVLQTAIDALGGVVTLPTLGDLALVNNALYNQIRAQIGLIPITLPPSAAIAGIYARVDADRGVWKAPANVGLNYVIEPSVQVSHEDQRDLNVDTLAGKSVNAIRAFVGKGNLVWGSRTLAGNDNEWRYVPVRRFFNMAEESIKKATEQFVFEPNDKNTWVRVKAMIDNFLTGQWRAGALAGPAPDKAFYVSVGLGETMTAQDILEGNMIIEIGMAVVRPAEFIILKFSHKMQEA